MAAGDSDAVVRVPGLARARDARAVHHGRRAHLLGDGEERCLGCRPLRSRRAGQRLRSGVSDPDLACVCPLRPHSRRVRRAQDDQQPDHVSCRGAGVPDRPPGRRSVVGSARSGDDGRRAFDGLHGDGDDRERVLPHLPPGCIRARVAARAADCSPLPRVLRGSGPRVSHPLAGDRRGSCRSHRSPASRSLSAGRAGSDALGVPLALCGLRCRGGHRHRWAGGTREAVEFPPRLVCRRWRRPLRRRARSALRRLPPCRARSVPRRDSRGCDTRPPGACAVARPAAPGAPRGRDRPARVDDPRRRHLRIALRRSHPGAQHVRPRPVVRHPPARVGRAWRAAAAGAGRVGCRRIRIARACHPVRPLRRRRRRCPTR